MNKGKYKIHCSCGYETDSDFQHSMHEWWVHGILGKTHWPEIPILQSRIEELERRVAALDGKESLTQIFERIKKEHKMQP